ncbi:hypothetical protein P8C59_006182 [Phyllachora maydis]|uniref:Uncharacterized protein n=1 Tax=Phyllachora maydis TaxID=1825666 RepID=A0AAD9I688_9PEZI|nr:hypothetical protein P8C59_006182 [Phyllachora maydis]
MYGSYGSYSAMATPRDIAPRPLSSRAQDASCAFPSWPRRSSLSASDCEERPTSYLSDEDLFLGDATEDDAHSVSSSAGSCASPTQSPQIRPMTDADVEELERERAAYQREVVRFLLNEKERRRQQALRRAAAAGAAAAASSSAHAPGSARKSPKSKLSSMTPIAEAA